MTSAQKQSDPRAALEAAVKETLDHINKKFIVMSGKGGVGKTSTAVNLAIAASRAGARVGLMDVDLHGPDIPHMLGYNGVLDVTAENKLLPFRYNDRLSAVSVESLIEDKDNAIIWRGPVKHSMIQQFIGQTAWGDLDLLIVDAPPGTGDEPLTVAQSIKDARAIIVTTPQEVSLADVRKSINFCKTVKMEILGLIENMSGFACPHCNSVLDLFGSGGGERTAAAMAVNFLGAVPFDPQMVECGDEGIAVQERYPDSPVTRAYVKIVEKLMA
ncbi:MAG: Mrp/NBP35 family ATP-binding protein [Desulfatitalea sp.]|nr:Mrp/NBP35 family ATP-binding protein [Desulfatitalea sp.]NNK00758.1 Mrp/NBP35 family ATP-binding protein [Desulfatitalea sp.]